MSEIKSSVAISVIIIFHMYSHLTNLEPGLPIEFSSL